MRTIVVIMTSLVMSEMKKRKEKVADLGEKPHCCPQCDYFCSLSYNVKKLMRMQTFKWSHCDDTCSNLYMMTALALNCEFCKDRANLSIETFYLRVLQLCLLPFNEVGASHENVSLTRTQKVSLFPHIFIKRDFVSSQPVMDGLFVAKWLCLFHIQSIFLNCRNIQFKGKWER